MKLISCQIRNSLAGNQPTTLPDLIPDLESLPPLLSNFVEDSSDALQDFEPSPPYDPLGQFHSINGLHQPLNHFFFHNNLISGSEAQTLLKPLNR